MTVPSGAPISLPTRSPIRLDSLIQPETFQPLHALLEDQAYRVAYCRVASSEIN